VTIGKPEKKMGQQGAECLRRDLRGCARTDHVPSGEEGEGMKVAMSVLDRGRLRISA